MEKIISKKDLDYLKKLKGEVTGISLKNDLDFILKKEGREGLKKLENTMVGAGFPIKYEEVKPADLYPFRFAITLIIIIKRLFDYNDKKLEEMGKVEARISSWIIRLFMKYFVSVEMVAREVPKMWREHYTIGEPQVAEYNKEKTYAILRIKNFQSHPFLCQVHKGYFAAMLEMVVGKNVSCKETKCIFRGDPYHEFLLKW